MSNERLSTKMMYCEELNCVMYISVYMVDEEEKLSDIRIVDIDEKREIQLDDIWEHEWKTIG